MLAGTVPFVVCVGVNVKPVPLHAIVPIVVIDGVGFNVTVRVNVVPVQLPAVGVTV